MLGTGFMLHDKNGFWTRSKSTSCLSHIVNKNRERNFLFCPLSFYIEHFASSLKKRLECK